MPQYDHFPGHYLETSFLIFIRVGMLHIVTRRSYPEVSTSFLKNKKQTHTHQQRNKTIKAYISQFL